MVVSGNPFGDPSSIGKKKKLRLVILGYVYIYIYIYICTHTCIHTCIHIYTHTHIYIGTCMYVCIYIYIYTHMGGQPWGGEAADGRRAGEREESCKE